MNATITAVAAQSNGKPEPAAVITIAAPVAASGQTLLQISRAGVNFVDIYQARGRYLMPKGTVLGFEGVGTAPDGKRYAVLDHQGTYAQSIAVPDDRLIPVPDDIDDDHAMILFQGITAQYLTASIHPVREGETALVYAAAGGVGWTLMQVIKSAGARPIGIVSSEAKARPLRERGYEVLVGDGKDLALVRDLVPNGVDVVFDANGVDTWELTFSSVRTRGHVVIYGGASGEPPAFIVSMLRDRGSLTLTYGSIFPHIADRAELLARAETVFTWLRNGTIAAPEFHTFPIERAEDALRFLESRKSTGKLLLIP
jgi:NADPH2:quinone reductase